MDDHPPYAAYAGIAATFLTGITGVAVLAARRNRPLEPPRAIDLALLGLATFKGSRTVARNKVARGCSGRSASSSPARAASAPGLPPRSAP